MSFSKQSSMVSTETATTLGTEYPPNKSGNHIGMRACITQADEGDSVEYALLLDNEASGFALLRWVPCELEPGPDYY